jgi:nitroreductase
MLEIINQHRSVRKFTDSPIDRKIIEKILEAGTRASTTGNMQTYSVVITTDKDIKKRLWMAHFKQNMVIEAPVIMTFCADFNRFNKWCHSRNADPGYDNFLSFFTAAIDALLVAQNISIAAETYSLGICYLGTTTYMADEIIKILDLPEFVVPVTSIVIGHPAEIPELTDRLPLQGVVHYEKYTDYSAENITALYSEKESSELTARLLKENNKETLAQIFTDNRYTRKDNIHFSQSLLKVLKEQGFMNNESSFESE